VTEISNNDSKQQKAQVKYHEWTDGFFFWLTLWKWLLTEPHADKHNQSIKLN